MRNKKKSLRSCIEFAPHDAVCSALISNPSQTSRNKGVHVIDIVRISRWSATQYCYESEDREIGEEEASLASFAACISFVLFFGVRSLNFAGFSQRKSSESKINASVKFESGKNERECVYNPSRQFALTGDMKSSGANTFMNIFFSSFLRVKVDLPNIRVS